MDQLNMKVGGKKKKKMFKIFIRNNYGNGNLLVH